MAPGSASSRGSRQSLPLSALFDDAQPPAGHVGVDEAGRGCLAGPVVAAAVQLRAPLEGLDDSKKLSAKRRDELALLVRRGGHAWSLAVVWPWAIDETNILRASLEAMARAVTLLAARHGAPSIVLVDGDKTIPPLAPPFECLPQRAIVGGDALVPAISAASILAKTFRDKLLTALDRRYPGYGFARHKGYGTAQHLAAIRELGPCRMHRLTFRGVRSEEPREERQAWLPGI